VEPSKRCRDSTWRVIDWILFFPFLFFRCYAPLCGVLWLFFSGSCRAGSGGVPDAGGAASVYGRQVKLYRDQDLVTGLFKEGD